MRIVWIIDNKFRELYGLHDLKKNLSNLNEILVKIRSTGKLIKSKLILEKNDAKLELLEDEYGISPGQACVFYSKDKYGDKVLGGGWISKN